MSAPSRFCAICTGDVRGPAAREPLGKDGALVIVCVTCATSHPRDGRYSFGGDGTTTKDHLRPGLARGARHHG